MARTEVTGDEMVAAMDAVGVDGAMLVSPFAMYRYDASYALEVYAGASRPGSAWSSRSIPTDPAVAETIADWAAIKGTVGVRIMMNQTVSTDPADPGLNRVLAAAAQHALPVNLLCWGRLDQAGQLAARNPDTQAGHRPPRPATALRAARRRPSPSPTCRSVLALAAHRNIAVKISGACTLSHEPFPYNDIWDPLGRIFDAFGLDRCLWGTDWTRASSC